MTVYFYGQTNAYGVFSNFHECDFEYMGHRCKSSEQALMMAKADVFGDEATLEKIKRADAPGVCKRLGRSVKPYKDSVWAAARYDKMVEILKLKFADPRLRKVLLDTANAVIAEASPTDRIWGIGRGVSEARGGAKWLGENLLGQALMEVRRFYAVNSMQ